MNGIPVIMCCVLIQLMVIAGATKPVPIIAYVSFGATVSILIGLIIVTIRKWWRVRQLKK